MSTRGPDIPQCSPDQWYEVFPDLPAGQSQNLPPRTLLNECLYLFSPPSTHFPSSLPCPSGIFLKKITCPQILVSESAPGASRMFKRPGQRVSCPPGPYACLCCPEVGQRHRAKDPMCWTAIWKNNLVFSPGMIFQADPLVPQCIRLTEPVVTASFSGC